MYKKIKNNYDEIDKEYNNIFNKQKLKFPILNNKYPILMNEDWFDALHSEKNLYLSFIREEKIKNMVWKTKILDEKICIINNTDESLTMKFKRY